jgi:hypothetical protein
MPALQVVPSESWDDETKSMVDSVLRKYKSPGASLDNITNTISSNTKVCHRCWKR